VQHKSLGFGGVVPHRIAPKPAVSLTEPGINLESAVKITCFKGGGNNIVTL
jgi:hypothetical protein